MIPFVSHLFRLVQSSFDLRDRREERVRVLGTNGVPERFESLAAVFDSSSFNSVHPTGNPMYSSTNIGDSVPVDERRFSVPESSEGMSLITCSFNGWEFFSTVLCEACPFFQSRADGVAESFA